MAERFHRRSIRLKGYDYAQAGAYYVTVCTHERVHLFGDAADGNAVPNAMGNIVQRCWDAIPEHMPIVVCDAFVVMPNHVHGIVVITDVPVVGRGTVWAANSPLLRNAGPADDHVDTTPTDVLRKPSVAIMVPNSLGHIMQTFKAAVTRQVYRDGLMPRGMPIWQRGYYERIIRDDGEHERIAKYIRDNPANWNTYRFHRR